MFEKVKKALRFSNNALDDDLKRNIDAALLDMGRVGVGADKTSLPSNAWLSTASGYITLWARATIILKLMSACVTL